MSVRVRIAPSPTGDPHVGTAYIALFNYCFAKQHGGQFVLRIEDTDQARSRAHSEAAIQRALRWVGLEWDEGPDKGGPYGPYRQSERLPIYREHAELLIQRGLAYRCFATEAELTAMRDEQKKAGAQIVKYDGRYRDYPAVEGEARAKAGDAYVIRLKTPQVGTIVFQDHFRGQVEFDTSQLDDQVLLKSDGFPTYHLASVVDDHLMKITHVIRAEEWISSTPKHVLLYQCFGWDAPVWVHMPLLRNMDKSKISKRKNPVSIDYYRDAGILPEALANFLGKMGYSLKSDPDREKFTVPEMVADFDISRVSLGGPVFDLEKLHWLNGMYLRDMTDEELVKRLREWKLSDEYLLQAAKLLRERIRRLDEFIPAGEFFFSGDSDYTAVAVDMVPKGKTPADVGKVLLELVDALDAHEDYTPAPLEAAARAFCETAGWKPKELFMPLRLALTGRKASPGLFDTMVLIGREGSRRRLRVAAEFLKSRPAT